MIKINYKLKTEKFEEEEDEKQMVEITAETDHPSTKIIFEKSSKLLAETYTDTEGVSTCGFTPQKRKCVVKAIIGEETAQITVPKMADLNEDDGDE